MPDVSRASEGYAQTGKALKKIVAVLATADGGSEHIACLTWTVTDKAAYRTSVPRLRPLYREAMGKNFPAMAVVQVVALVEDRAKVEIEATAVLPKD